MKFLVLALALLAGASAFPDVQGRQSEGELFVINLRAAIEAIQRYIVRNNLDPLVLVRSDRTIANFPYLNVQLFIEGVDFRGLSNIVIHNLDYSNIFSRLRFDLELPELDFAIGDSGISGTILSNDVSAKLAGRLIITNGRLSGEVYVNADLLTGRITITEVTSDFSIGGIQSDITIQWLANDYSEWVNELLNNRIPNFLTQNKNDINRLVASAIKLLGELYLQYWPRV